MKDLPKFEITETKITKGGGGLGEGLIYLIISIIIIILILQK